MRLFSYRFVIILFLYLSVSGTNYNQTAHCNLETLTFLKRTLLHCAYRWEVCWYSRNTVLITLCLTWCSFTKPKKANKRVVLHWAVYLSFKLPLDSIYHNSKIFYNFASLSVWLKKFRWWIILWIRIEKKKSADFQFNCLF